MHTLQITLIYPDTNYQKLLILSIEYRIPNRKLAKGTAM